MAEGLFTKAVADMESVECIGSAGVAAFAGDRISQDTKNLLEKKEAGIEGFRSRSASEYLLAEATHVFAMTGSHLEMLKNGFPDHAEKCSLLCDFVALNGKVGMDVPDPIGMGPQAYQAVGEVIELAIPGILNHINS